MRVTLCLTAALCLAILAVPASADHHETPLMQEVAAIGDAMSEAMLDDDVETMLDMYAEDVISLPNFGPRMDGVDAIRQHHAQMTAAGMEIHSFESTPTEVWEAGDKVIEIGTFVIELEMPGMGAIDDQGKYMTVYVRDDEGNLKVKAETWNTDMNPMAMMGGDDASMSEHMMDEGKDMMEEGETMMDDAEEMVEDGEAMMDEAKESMDDE